MRIPRAHIVFCVQNMSVPRDPRVWREARTLAEAGHRVAVICPAEEGLPANEVREGVEIHRFARAPVLPGPLGLGLETLNALVRMTALALRRHLRQRIDVLHVANPPDTMFLVAWPLRPFGTRLVFDQHDLCPEFAEVKWGRGRLLGGLMRCLEWASYRSADLVIVTNESYRAVAMDRGGVEPARVLVVRNGPDQARRTASPRAERPLLVAYAGVIGSHDGLGTLLEAAALVSRRRPGSIRLDLIGAGEDVDRLRGLAATLGIASCVNWAGWLTGDAYSRRLHAAHVAVSPDPDDALSRRSTMIKVTEYMAGAMPAVVADLPENRVSAGDAALYFKPGDAAELARRLEELIETPQLLEELAQRARKRGPALLWANSAVRLVAAYGHLLAGGPPVVGEQVVT